MNLNERIYELFEKQTIDSISKAMVVINRMNPNTTEANASWNYWNDLECIEFDMATLSSLHAYIAELQAKVKNDARRLTSSLKVLRATRYNELRSYYEKSTPKVKVTAKDLDAEVECTQALIDKQEEAADFIEASDLLEANLNAIKEHINVLKKRRETLLQEFQFSKNQIT